MAKTNFIQSDLFDKGIPVRACKICKMMKTLDQFSPMSHQTPKGKRTMLHTWCKGCKAGDMARRHELDQEYYAAQQLKIQKENPGKTKKTQTYARARHTYGLSKEEYDGMFAQQRNTCAICKKEETCKDTNTGRARRLAVDHCHKANRVRQLLCHACNRGLAGFMDDPALLRAAAEYIEHHRKLHESEP